MFFFFIKSTALSFDVKLLRICGNNKLAITNSFFFVYTNVQNIMVINEVYLILVKALIFQVLFVKVQLFVINNKWSTKIVKVHE